MALASHSFERASGRHSCTGLLYFRESERLLVEATETPPSIWFLALLFIILDFVIKSLQMLLQLFLVILEITLSQYKLSVKLTLPTRMI